MANFQEDLHRIQKVYETTYQQSATDYDYVWHAMNPVALYYRQSQERVLAKLFRNHPLSLENMYIADIGCGTGWFLRLLASWGVRSTNLHGIDLMPYRIERALELGPPDANYIIGEASHLPYTSNSFDLVSQFTVLSSIFDQEIRKIVAQEMLRILKPKGYILWYDIRYGHSKNTKSIEISEVAKLFSGGKFHQVQKLHHPWISLLCKKYSFLNELIDRIPGIKRTHYLILITK